jgi:3-oxoacyl-[acyl-carrier-protein] synthase I
MKNVYVASSNIVSPLGFTTDDNFQAVLAGKSGLKNHNLGFSEHDFYTSIVPEETLTEKFGKLCFDQNGFTKLEKMSIISIADAIQKSGISLTQKDTLFIYCTTKGNIDLLKDNDTPEGVSLYHLSRKIANFFGLPNEPLIVSNACISSLQGLLVAQRFIQAGRYNHVIVTGGEIVTKFTLSGFKSFNAMSDTACKPFDLNRKGINIGEATATVVLTNDKNFQGENTAVIAGHVSNDANHISAPSRTGEGLFQAIQKTLTYTKSEIDFVSTHGTGTLYNDDMESNAFHRSNLSKTPMNSLKGYFGHTLGASGLLESIIAIRAAQANELIPSAGFEDCGTPFELALIKQRESKEIKHFLKTSSGFGGCNAAVLFAKL